MMEIFTQWWAWLVAVAAVIGIIERLWKPIRIARDAGKRTATFAKRFVGSVNHIESMREDVTEIKCKIDAHEIALDYLQKEFRPNGGSSTRDQLNHINMQLQRVAQKHKVDMEMSSNGIFQCDKDGNYSYVNKTLANALGVTKEDLYGRNWENYFGSKEFKDKWFEGIKSGRDTLFYTEIADIDGEKIKVKISTTPFDDGYTGYIEFHKTQTHEYKNPR